MREEGVGPQRQHGAKGRRDRLLAVGPWVVVAGGGQGEPEAEQHPGRVCVVLPLPALHHPSKAPPTPAPVPESIPKPSSDPGLPWPGPRGHIYHPLTLTD